MRRREFIAGLGSTAAWLTSAGAQQLDRPRRIGVLMGVYEGETASHGYVATLRDALAKLGWIEGKNLQIDFRVAAGDIAQIRSASAQLVGLAPEVIFVFTGDPTRAVVQQTQTIPIVFAGPSVEITGVKNVARPEGNVTGFPVLFPTIGGKSLELLKEAAPQIRRVAALMTAESFRRGNAYMTAVDEAALALNVKVIATPFNARSDFEKAIDAFAGESDGGLLILANNFTADPNNQELMRELAEQRRLPAIHWDKRYPHRGGLMSYGSDFVDLFPRAASYVDRLLRGAKVSELPVQYPTRFELVINVRTAKALGLAIPETLLLQANEVIG
jgi:putative tryptophan/tyrosine transport system substrate-binding protein